MTHSIRFAFIGLLVLIVGLWVGLSAKPNIDKIPGCDASLTWCLNSDQTLSLQVIGAAKGSIQGQPIATPALIHINLKGVDEEPLKTTPLVGRISGVNMYMGQFDVVFKRQQNQWQGLTSLPSCVDQHPMVWKIELLKTGKPTGTHFLFSSHQN